MQRLDKFLWFARFYKSRTLAAATVAAGRVRVNGQRCEKPSHIVKPGDVLTFSAGARVRVVRVLAGGTRRGPASEARMLFADLTPPPEASLPPLAERPKGAGRPTKKARRAIDEFTRASESED